MSSLLNISVHITLKQANDPPLLALQSSSDNQMQSELWVTCTNPQCFQTGNTNALAQQSSEVQ